MRLTSNRKQYGAIMSFYMTARWIKQITFGIAGVWMLWLAAQSYAHVGLVTDTTFDAGLGLIMMVLAITAKSG